MSTNETAADGRSQHDDGPPARGAKFRRAALRHSVFTLTADRLTLGVLTRRHERQPIHEKAIELRLPNWPLAYDGVRIVHVSDFHVGHLMSAERAIETLAAVRRLKPDLVACTGDVVDLEAEPAAPVLEALGACEAPLGSLLVLGNHDHLDHPRRLARVAERAGVTVLDDRVALLGTPGARLRVGGVDWARTIGQCGRRVKRTWSHGRGFDLLLAHNPKAFVAAAKLGVSLTLSGHTHGNQFSLRKSPTPPRFSRRLTAGLYRRGDSALFVTVGLGAWFPLRVNCPPEIAVLTVRRG